MLSPMTMIKRFHPKSGGDSEEVPPVPMPNTEVKLFSADDNEGATLCESRTLPGRNFKIKNTRHSTEIMVYLFNVSE